MSAFGNPLTEYSPQMEAFDPLTAAQYERRGVFSEEEELALASELLEIQNEQELDHFLGDLIKKVGGAIGSIVKSPIGRAIGGVLKTALPVAGTALGGLVGGPVGAMLGSNLASVAGGALGLELEGLSAEDREFHAARQFCRFASAAIRNALEAPLAGDPAALAHTAALEAARIHAPGLMNIAGKDGRSENSPQTGRWIRQGDQIILFGL